MRVDVYSTGNGVQSTAMLALVATGDLPKAPFVFANVGADSEHPATLAYLEQHARPFAEANQIELVTVERVPRRGRFAGEVETLWSRLMHPDSRSLPIPVRMSNGAPGTRSCTADFKIRPIGQWMRETLGATAEDPAYVALGISVDEIERAVPGVDPRASYQHRVYPLLDLGLRRSDCRGVIEAAGLPVPPKSACFFCPFHDAEAWARLHRETPQLFDRACHLEETLTARRAQLGKDPVYLTRHGRPLAEVVTSNQGVLDGMDVGCDSGWCMT